MWRGFRSWAMGLICLGFAAVGLQAGEVRLLRVAALDSTPPVAYRDQEGRLTGFNIEVMRALCTEMAVICDFQVVTLDRLLDDIAAGRFDVAAIGLLDTPERRQKVIFSRPIYRSLTLMFIRQGAKSGQPGIRWSVQRGSVQERYVRQKGWDYIGAKTNAEMIEQLRAGVAQACLVPLVTSLYLQHTPAFLQLDLEMSLLRHPELEGEAAFAIAPQRPELKGPLDRAIERIKLNGIYDRINSRYLPFRVD
jgi:ABC-type amino acid transport substrate-binding protein